MILSITYLFIYYILYLFMNSRLYNYKFCIVYKNVPCSFISLGGQFTRKIDELKFFKDGNNHWQLLILIN